MTNRLHFVVATPDLSDNCVGRAFILADMLSGHADVTLVGPTNMLGGSRVWRPISASKVTVIALRSGSYDTLRYSVGRLVTSTRPDAVIVSKARFSSLFIGFELARTWRCPLLLDIDEDEMAFVDNGQGAPSKETLLSELESGDPWPPIDEWLWTALAQYLIPDVGGLTVSSATLQAKFGGAILRHARDETLFDPMRYDRQLQRASLGYGDEDRVVLFLGTPRAHKGIAKIDRALANISDSRIKFRVIGAPNKLRQAHYLRDLHYPHTKTSPQVPWDKIAPLVHTADLVCLLQEKMSPVARTQTPAKFTDALAMNVPVIASATPPMEELAAMDLVTLTSDEDVERQICDVLSAGRRSKKNRPAFVEEFGYRVNTRRLIKSIEEIPYPQTRRPPLLEAVESAWAQNSKRLRDERACIA